MLRVLFFWQETWWGAHPWASLHPRYQGLYQHKGHQNLLPLEKYNSYDKLVFRKLNSRFPNSIKVWESQADSQTAQSLVDQGQEKTTAQTCCVCPVSRKPVNCTASHQYVLQCNNTCSCSTNFQGSVPAYFLLRKVPEVTGQSTHWEVWRESENGHVAPFIAITFPPSCHLHSLSRAEARKLCCDGAAVASHNSGATKISCFNGNRDTEEHKTIYTSLISPWKKALHLYRSMSDSEQKPSLLSWTIINPEKSSYPNLKLHPAGDFPQKANTVAGESFPTQIFPSESEAVRHLPTTKLHHSRGN